MQGRQLIECVPNFSEGRNMAIIKEITDQITSVAGVQLLDVDPGADTNRTVVTFVGEPAQVVEAAYLAIKKAGQLIDMRKHKGEHPRMGATDVCPLVPISNITLAETAVWAKKLGEKCADLGIPIFLYEAAASTPARKNLATIRAGEYEGMEDKLAKPDWKPDYGPVTFNPQSGCTAIGARDFLIAYNVNLNTTSVRRANSVAFDIREKGRVLREGNPVTGKIVTDAAGQPVRTQGMCKGVKAIGWYIDEYGVAQISMNITDIRATPLHEAFEACRKSANARGMRVTGSELVGLVPKQVMLDAGKYYLKAQGRSTGISEREIIKIAVKSLGLDELSPFDPEKKVIEYLLDKDQGDHLVQMTLHDFAMETASESPAPGGGSIAAYMGALGAALATMVANLSANKRGWDDRLETFSDHADTGQALIQRLMHLVDEDTRAFNGIMDAFKLPKATDEEVKHRTAAIQAATLYAIDTPLAVMRACGEVLSLCKTMADQGNPNSVSDAGVGALAAQAAMHGAYLNVCINAKDLTDSDVRSQRLSQAKGLLEGGSAMQSEILTKVYAVIGV